MVGNDIVDTARAKKDSNWERPGFLNKLFTTQEQEIIHRSKDSFLTVWKLWSIKEAAYKLYVQINPCRFYNPKKFKYAKEANCEVVRFNDFKCYVSTKITLDYIISEARLDLKSMTSKVFKFQNIAPELQSKTIRNEALIYMSRHLNKPIESIKIMTTEYSIPVVKTYSRDWPISLTHHGDYGAFALT